MKLKFKQQKYQEDACMSVVKCFEGQAKGDRKNLIDRRHFIRNEGTFWEEEVDEEVISFGNKKIPNTNKTITINPIIIFFIFTPILIISQLIILQNN